MTTQLMIQAETSVFLKHNCSYTHHFQIQILQKKICKTLKEGFMWPADWLDLAFPIIHLNH